MPLAQADHSRMAFDVNNPYFRTKVMTASREELRLLLLDGCLHFIDVGTEGLETKNYEKVYEGYSQAKAIVMELINALRPEVAPELCEKLSALYTYIYKLLVEAGFEKDPEKARQARQLVEFDRETWRMLMEQIKAGGSLDAEAHAQAMPDAVDLESASKAGHAGINAADLEAANKAMPKPNVPARGTGTYSPPNAHRPSGRGLSIRG